jgi:hypothetical protein
MNGIEVAKKIRWQTDLENAYMVAVSRLSELMNLINFEIYFDRFSLKPMRISEIGEILDTARLRLKRPAETMPLQRLRTVCADL